MNRAERRRRDRDKEPRPPFDAGTVCVGVPHRGVEDEFFDSMMNVLLYERERITEVVSVGGAMVTPARNAIARRFLAGRAEWLWTVDADMHFSADVVRALLAHADPVERPVVGALCFKVARDGMVEPTMYRLGFQPHTHLRAVREWQPEALVQVDATGAACLLIHRSVLEALDDGSHSAWYDEAELSGERLGEDISFCLRVRQAGFPIFVASTVDIGHVKPRLFGLEDWRRQQTEMAAIPTFAVVPVREKGDPLPTIEGAANIIAIANDELTAEVRGACPTNTAAKFNMGLAEAEQRARFFGHSRWNVLFVNDDVVLGDGCVEKMAVALRADPVYALAYPNVHGLSGDGVVTTRTDDPGGLTHAGWCFMVRGESARRFDERLVWHWLDNDYEKQIHAAGLKVACVLDARADHLHGNESTMADPRLVAQSEKDRMLFADKWGIDPTLLPSAVHASSSA